MDNLTSEDWDVLCSTASEKKAKKSHRRSVSLGHHDQLQLIRQHLQKNKEGSKQPNSSKLRHSPVSANHCALTSSQSTNVFSQPKSISPSINNNNNKATMPRYQRNSVEGLNTEIEKLVLKSISLMEDEDNTHDIPDGHRAPLPDQQQHQQYSLGGCNANNNGPNSLATTRTLYTQTPSSCFESREVSSVSSNSSSSSTANRSHSVSPAMPVIPNAHIDTSRPSSQIASKSEHSSTDTEKGDPDFSVVDSPEPKFVSSPKPNMSYSFAREPPDGCERIKATCVESAKKTPAIKEPLLFCSPKNTAYVLKPSVTSAFNPLYKSLMTQSPELALCSPAANSNQPQASFEGQ
ncbi:Hypothetical predicted protein [Octopus vulgaris]|uniref:Uncharacterized protein n=2 Tax=Octopus TaxID=6643 RepID=A0AA36F1Z8_OCTVU|nr:glucocorticoid-induced transcript 1 protein-like [Octopus sinensis]CAI9721564.1 Hypothetical predicted protein [Octopus vulgaris]